MNSIYFRTVIATAVLLIGSAQALGQGLPTSATMQFGNTGTGSPFPPPLGHDQSFHAQDKMVPRTVTIATGGTVTFLLGNAVHGGAVYAAGTSISDINTGSIDFLPTCPPVPYVADSNDRLDWFGPLCAGGTAAHTTTFNTPGRYLVICTFVPHLVDGDMYGWVIVKDPTAGG